MSLMVIVPVIIFFIIFFSVFINIFTGHKKAVNQTQDMVKKIVDYKNKTVFNNTAEHNSTTCEYCGSKIEPNSTKCSSCGAKIKK